MSDNVVSMAGQSIDPEHAQHVRLIEALLFAAAEPLGDAVLRARLPEEADLAAILADLGRLYEGRGVNLVRIAEGWALRTAPDLTSRIRLSKDVPRKPSRAAVETLSIIAYHQPVTRAEIESIRGVTTSKGTLDLLMEADWVRPGRRRATPGRPLTWITTKTFLDHFGLASLDDLPGIDELKSAGLLDTRPAIDTLEDRAAPAGDPVDTESEDDAAEDGEDEALAEDDLFADPAS